MRKRRILIALAAAALLNACGGLGGRNAPRVVSGPQVLVQEIKLENDQAVARVLLHNFSNVEITFSRLQFQLKFEGITVAEGSQTLELLVPQDSPENLSLNLRLSPAGISRLKGKTAFAYSIGGKIESSKPSRTFDYTYEGELSPTPGKPGFWR
jgi:LEA14-like dessication related protein